MAARQKESGEEKSLRIALNCVKRVLKELSSYETEVDVNRARVEEIASGADADEYDVRKAKEVLAESESMIPIVAKQLDSFAKRLGDAIEAFDGDDERIVEAKQLLNDAQARLQKQ
jgi:S-adenosylmethionine synthetase